MKQILKTASILVIAFVMVGAVFPVAHAAPPHQEDTLIGALEAMTGTVEHQLADGDAWNPVDNRVVLAEGDRVRTGDDGEARLTWFSDGTLMDIQPNSELTISEMSIETDANAGSESTNGGIFTISVDLTRGRVLNSVRRLVDDESTYEINASGITISVRGTVFAVDQSTDGTVTVATADGVVDVASSEPSVVGSAVTTAVEAGLISIFAPDSDTVSYPLQAGLDGGDDLAQALVDFFTELEEEIPSGEDIEDIDGFPGTGNNSSTRDTLDGLNDTLEDTVEDAVPDTDTIIDETSNPSDLLN